MENPDEMPVESHRSMMNMLFDRCLCCFRYHGEVWISRSRYEQSVTGAVEARNILREAVEVNPEQCILRVALAELEEQCGNLEAAHAVYRSAFDSYPTPYIFAVFQRFLRRRNGKIAARNLFAETAQLRLSGLLGHEV
jgi:hypothetical protein